jgi:hypothetical protein
LGPGREKRINMTQLTENIFAIEVPEDAERFTLRATVHCENGSLSCYDKFNGKETLILIPPGSYSFLCTSTEITEEQCKEIVPIEWGGFAGNVKGYMVYFKPGEWWVDHEPYKTALESFNSLLESKSLGRVAIIKKL